jgi:hypothetical protein
MNVEIVTEAAQFLFWEYLFRIFCIVSMQCGGLNYVHKGATSLLFVVDTLWLNHGVQL